MLRQWDTDTAPLDDPDGSPGLFRVDRSRGAGRDLGPGDFGDTSGSPADERGQHVGQGQALLADRLVTVTRTGPDGRSRCMLV